MLKKNILLLYITTLTLHGISQSCSFSGGLQNGFWKNDFLIHVEAGLYSNQPGTTNISYNMDDGTWEYGPIIEHYYVNKRIYNISIHIEHITPIDSSGVIIGYDTCYINMPVSFSNVPLYPGSDPCPAYFGLRSVQDYPNPSFDFEAILMGSEGHATLFEWDYGDGNTFSGLGGNGSHPSHTYPSPGNYTVTVDAYDTIKYNGTSVDTICHYSQSRLITVLDPSISIEEIKLNNFKLFPNPSDGIIHIQSTIALNNFKASVLSLNGKTIKVIDNLSAKKINIQDLNKGFYILNVQEKNNLSQSIQIKFIKQ